MRIWLSGPRLFNGLVRPGISFALSELRKKPTRAKHGVAANAAPRQDVTATNAAPELPTTAPPAPEPYPVVARAIVLVLYAFALLGLISMVGCAFGGAHAETALQCDSLPPAASIEVFTTDQTAAVCVEMLRVLEGVMPEDIATFSKVAVMLSVNGYQEDRVQIVQEIVEIIRLRGQFNKRARWDATYDEIYRSWVAFHGIVSPKDIIVNLRAMGPDAAREMTDEAFAMLIMTIKYLRQHGGGFVTPR